MERPVNPYKEGTLIWKVMQGSLDDWPDGGWRDLTTKQIAEILDVGQNSVAWAIGEIRRRTKYSVPYIDGRGRSRE